MPNRAWEGKVGFAVPSSGIKSIKGLAGKRIATELLM